MSLLILILGYLPLALISIVLFTASFIEIVLRTQLIPLSLLFILVILSMTLTLHGQAFRFFNDRFKTPFKHKKADLQTLIIILIAGVITFSLNHPFGFGGFMASGTVGLIGTLMFTKHCVAIYTGSFVGMTHLHFLPDLYCVSLALIITGLLFIWGQSAYQGFGGKLGTLSLLGTLLSGLVMGHFPFSSPFPGLGTGLMIILFSLIGCSITLFIRATFNQNPVFASSVVTLLITFSVYLESGSFSHIYIAAAMCGSFVGMTQRHHLPHVLLYLLASLFAGTLLIFSTPFLENAGGKLGTLAFGSVLSVKGFTDLYHLITLYIHGRYGKSTYLSEAHE
ncbi:hypothetical protein DES38_11622 [Streptohalobacillus salinus]|uniref:Uncharacterized protein n=1 Tax=Streptohalobacillus salinus TaxID=621096 RepID=A0A2V3W502_9BACI|nr:hypothetical protein [Streptohalobacillus salinus]PXW87335.1 hypothetical protein DES38_11622 [Streptohalobacillus salinus]